MALDSQLTQNINLRANGDALLRPLQAMGNQLNRLVQQMQQVANPSTEKGRQQLQGLTREAQKTLGTLKTINDLMNNGSRTGRAKSSLLSGLSEQAFGKTVLNASKLKTELQSTTKASEALEVRLAQLHKKFNDLGNAGKAIGKRDIAKALNTQEALRQVQQLEREIARLDGRNAARGGLSSEGAALRARVGTSYDTLLGRAKNGRRVDFSKEIAETTLLVDSYKKVSREIEATAAASARAAAKRRADIMDTINMNDAQFRAMIARQSSQFKFTPDQAKQFNIPALNAQIAEGTQRARAYALAMSRAVEQGRNPALLDRLANGFKRVTQNVAEAEAKVKAFDALPAQKMKALTGALFADGGMAFGARILGASLITTGIFATINAAQQAAQYVGQLEDAFAKLQAISGSTNTEMEKFSGSLMKLAENSRYSALEIAEGATQLVQAGYSAAETTTVLQASLNLAAGSGSTVAEAVDTMTSSLGAFNLQASEAGHVADVLMMGLNASKLSIQQMQAALQYSAATAHEAGISLEELTAVAASLANAGIKSGSTIGTGLRQLLVDLQTPTEKLKNELDSLGLTMADVDVKSKGLAGVVKTLTDAGFSAEAAYNGLEVRAAAAFLAFRNQIDVYDELAAQLTNTGAAAEAAAKASQSLSAKWQQTKNKLGELVSMLAGPFLNALKAVVDIVGAVVGAFVAFLSAIGEMVGGATNLSMALTVLLPLLGACFGPTGIIIGAVTALLSLAGALGRNTDELDKLQAATNEATQKMQASRQTVSSVDDAISRLIERQTQLRGNSTALQVETLNLTEKFEGLSSILGGAAKSYDDLVSAMLRYRGVAMRDLQESARGQALASRDQMGPLANQLYRGNLSIVDLFRQNGGQNGFNNEPQLNSALSWAKRASTTPFESLSSEQLVDERLKLQKIINDLTAARKTTGVYKQYFEALNEQLNLIQQIAATRSKYDTALQQFNVARTANSPEEQKRFGDYTNLQSGISQGLDANKDKPGSGDSILRGQMALAKSQVASIEARMKQISQDSAEYRVLADDLARIKGEMARVQRASDEATRELLKKEKAGPGEDLTGEAVAALVRSQFKGANVYSYQKRSYKTQQILYNKYKAGKGPLAAKPGTSLHGSGHAFDMTPIPGLDIDQVAAFLESRGVELLEKLNEKDPTTGLYHWHFAWKPKKSNHQKMIDSELKSLLEETATDQRSAASTRIAAIISEAKGGAGDYSADAMGDALARYMQAATNEWDVKHPMSDTHGDPRLIAARAKERAAEMERVQEQVRKSWADYYKAIGDKAVQDADLAFKESQRILDEAVRNAEQISKDAQHQLDVAQNRVNQNNMDEGTLYVLNRRKEGADLASDQSKLLAQRQQLFRDQLIASQLEAKVNALPEGDDKKAKLEEVAQAWAKIREELQAVNDLQDSINARTQVFAELPLKERLEGAANAWREQNGAMDTWQKRVVDGVAPMLDTLKSGFTDLFASMMDGSKSVKQALVDFIKNFAQFVVQYIAQCMAMIAINAIMKALGIPVPGAFGGGQVKAAAPTPSSSAVGTPVNVAFNGGPVEIPGRFGGGIGHLSGGGSVRRGFTTRDSALYKLAAGEYVVRNKSVRELGIPFMDAINKHGAKGLAAMQGVQQNIVAPSKQEVNVWMVPQGTKPPVSKHDIVVAIGDDILQGGQTKQLIKQVVNGG